MKKLGPSSDLIRVVGIVSAWADEHPFVVAVYVFGSYARGDNHAGSDLDIAVLYDVDNHDAFTTYMSQHDHGTIRELERRVGIKLQVSEADSAFRPTRPFERDIVLPMIRERRERALYAVRKVHCIVLPPKPAQG